MIRNLKALGLAVVAVFAMSAMVASAAQATDDFRSESSPVIVKGENIGGKEKFTTPAGTIECNNKTEGTNTTPSTTATASPVYTACKAFIFFTAEVHMNGCDYLFHLTEGTTATSDIVCPTGSEITVTAPGCVIHVPPQTARPHIIFDNEGTGTTRDVKATVTVSGIHSTITEGCPGGAVTDTTGTYTGTETLKGYTDPNGTVQQGIWLE